MHDSDPQREEQIHELDELRHHIRELEETAASLKRERQNLYSLLDAIPGFVFLRGPDYTIRFANRYFHEHFGSPVEKPCYEIMANRDEPCDECRIISIFSTKKPQKWEWTSKVENRLYQIYDYPFVDLDSQLLVLEFGIDITDLKEKEVQLEQAKHQVEEFNKILEERLREEAAISREKDAFVLQQSRQAVMGEMMGNIAHQWRQPLNVISLLVQDLNESYTYGDFTREYLDNTINKIMDAIQHMSRTIEDFSDFLKPEKKKVLFSVRQSVEKTLSILEPALKHKKITFEIDIPQDISVMGYPNEYAHVLINIIINAKDIFLKRHVKEPRIAIRAFSEADRNILTVTDNAGGISKAMLDRIFEPYFTTRDKESGIGIGLYLSKTMIEKNMGGRLTVRNVENGAEFRIEV
jgi:signal transduction histidine kinase